MPLPLMGSHAVYGRFAVRARVARTPRPRAVSVGRWAETRRRLRGEEKARDGVICCLHTLMVVEAGGVLRDAFTLIDPCVPAPKPITPTPGLSLCCLMRSIEVVLY